jgi:hypothetical protein
MSGVKREKKGAVDALEHALQGVHTSENHERIISFDRNPGLIGTRAMVQVDVVNDSPWEREVIVNLNREPRPRSRSRR